VVKVLFLILRVRLIQSKGAERFYEIPSKLLLELNPAAAESHVAWVQCERASCRKWRRIPAAAVAALTDGAKWFCENNPDAAHAKCAQPQVSEWSCRKAAGGIPEAAREPSPVYPAGRVGTPADPNIPPGGVAEFVPRWR
jgi:hypothetical protein